MTNAEANTAKVYVPVLAAFRADGTILPRALIWEDGKKYIIDRVKQVCPAPALKAGGQGDRYTIMVEGKESYLFFERSTDVTETNLGRWFVERR